MGLIRDMVEAMREQQKKRDELDDDKTTDRYLRSLRRQVRRQKEFVEKLKLKKEIKDFELQRTREVVLGTIVKGDDVLIKGKIAKKKIKILKERQFKIPKKRPEKGFLSKGHI